MKSEKLVFAALLLFLCQGVLAQFVTRDEATMIANKYILKVIDRFGNWAGDSIAVAEPARELHYKGKLIGYWCNVEPDGFTVMSLRREFSPVKASSDRGRFNPEDTGGIVALVKERMAAHLDLVERAFGSIVTIPAEQVESILEFSCRESWNRLAAYSSSRKTDAPMLTGNYTEGDVLLTSNWHQRPPYNNECPDLGCTGQSNVRALVGCVATAGAQIMRYWCWPPNTYLTPSDPYQWWDMRDQVDPVTGPAAQQDAVAEICHDVGVQVGMEYGCAASSAATLEMVGVYTQNVYDFSCGYILRTAFEASVWWAIIKAQLNLNQPIHYRIDGHSIVCDGWRFDTAPDWEYHMNYGWLSSSSNMWYAFDQLPPFNVPAEYMVINIVPAVALGSVLSGVYSSGYHYINMDASGTSAVFLGGCLIQTLPGLFVKGSGLLPSVKFYGTSTSNTRIFTNGTSTSGIKIVNGGVVLLNGGQLVLNKPSE